MALEGRLKAAYAVPHGIDPDLVERAVRRRRTRRRVVAAISLGLVLVFAGVAGARSFADDPTDQLATVGPAVRSPQPAVLFEPVDPEMAPTREYGGEAAGAPATIDADGNAVPWFDDSLVYIVVYNNVAQIRVEDRADLASGELSRSDAIAAAPKIDVIAVYDAVTGDPYYSEGRSRFGSWTSTQDGAPVTDISGD